MHLARLAEAHLDLGRVHVDVDALGRDVDEENVGRLARAVQHVLVGRAHAVRDQAVAHEAAVDVDVLQVGARACRLGQAGTAAHAQNTEVERDLTARGDEVGIEHVLQALFGARAVPLLHELAVVPDHEADVGTRQRMAPYRLDAVREFGGLALKEFAPRRRREEELAHLHARPDRTRRRRELARARLEALRMRSIGGAAGERKLGDRRDRRQRLAAEAHRRDVLEVVQRRDLARRVAAQRERQLGGRDAAPVVFDDDRADAAARETHDDLGRGGIERVVDELAHDRRGPLDDFAGGDLADQLVGQFADRPARGGLQHGIHRRQARWLKGMRHCRKAGIDNR
jgi:hypothetical protein